MKKIIFITILTIISATFAFAQSKDEKEILKFIADYDQSYVNQDISFVETNLGEDYTISNPYGGFKNRAQAIEDYRKDKANSTEKTLSFKSTNESLRFAGNMAIASGTWTWSGVPISNLQAEPHNDKGRYTNIFEKRKGKWLLVSEMFSEAQHDKKEMEAQVLKLGLEYNQMIKRGDTAAIEKLLADDYLYTTDDGKVVNKTEELAHYKNLKSKIESIETTDQKVRVLGNNSAVETATIRIKGTDKDGKPFDDTERYTTTWVWRDLRWQIIADHTSTVKK